MGQLRSGILDLQKTSINLEPAISELEKQQDEYTQQVFGAAKRIEEGLNTLVLYLMEKLKKEKKTFESEGGKPLKDYLDPTSTGFAKGIVQAKNDVKGFIARLNASLKASVAKLSGTVNTSLATSTKLKGICDKKKAKWLKSSKYKAKINTYLAALTAVDEIFKAQDETIKGFESLSQNDSWVERCYKFDPAMTMAQVRQLASSELNTNLKDFNTQKQNVGGRAKKFREEYKSLGGQFAVLKKWTDEADEMESEE